MENDGASGLKRSDGLAWRIMLDHKSVECVDVGNAMWRLSAQFLVRHEHDRLSAAGDERTLERCIGNFESADAALARDRASAEQADINVHPRYCFERGAVDASADHGIDLAADKDELDITSGGEGGGNLDGVRGDRHVDAWR